MLSFSSNLINLGNIDIDNNKDLINIGGFVPLTTVDFPHHLSAVIFCQGCPLRCHYCHNPNLMLRKQNHHNVTKNHYTWDYIKDFLMRRLNLLEAVVFSGGEPTLQPGLIKAISFVKYLGFKVGIHTAGIYPNRLEKIMPYLDWIGLDIKAPFGEYQSITTVPNLDRLVIRSVKLIISSNVLYEFRTTVHPKLINKQQIKSIITMLKGLGAKNYKIQEFRSIGCINSELNSYISEFKDQYNQDIINKSINLDAFDEQSII
jgi:pyruvate formate lyase activating enzyme